jgi:serine/threonine protein phosphatase PrpC
MREVARARGANCRQLDQPQLGCIVVVVFAAGFEYVVRIQPIKGEGQDRAAVFEREGGLVIAVADGAGGTSNGEIAAQAVLETVETLAASDADWSVVLRALDGDAHRLDGGQTTAIVLVVDDRGVRGASIGDSEAWLVYSDRVDMLTAGQERKPLLGGGGHPVPTRAGPLGDATLVVGSDGLFRYARPIDIARLAMMADLETAAKLLVDLVRLPNGNVHDDVSVVLCRTIRI